MSDLVKRLEMLLDDLQGRIDATKLGMIQDTIGRIEALEAALKAFDPHRIGSGQSTDMQALAEAQKAARAVLSQDQ